MRWIGLAALLTGCAEIEKLREDLGKITNDFVISSFYIGTAEFSDERVDLSSLEDMQGTQALSYLVSAEVIDGSQPIPVTRADVVLSTDSGSSTVLDEGDAGVYSASQDDGLAYEAEQFVTITADYDEESHAVSVEAPEAPVFSVPENHAAGTEMNIDISNQGYDSALVFVAHFPIAIDSAPSIVYSNKPTSFRELYDFAYPSEESGTVGVTIPGDSFSEDGLYVISLGGVVAGDSEYMDNVNTALSSVLATKMGFDVVCVPDCSLFPQD